MMQYFYAYCSQDENPDEEPLIDGLKQRDFKESKFTL